MILLTKIFRTHHVRRGLQIAISIISPSVVRAVDSAFDVAARLLLKSGPTMSTDVVKAVDFPGFSTNDDEAFAIHFMQKEIAWFGDGGSSSDTDPLFQEDPVCFPIMNFLRCEIFAR